MCKIHEECCNRFQTIVLKFTVENKILFIILLFFIIILNISHSTVHMRKKTTDENERF